MILAFGVRTEQDTQEMADSLRVRIFSAEIIIYLMPLQHIGKTTRNRNKNLNI